MDLNDPKVQKSAVIVVLVAVLLYVFFATTWLPFTYKNYSSKIAKVQKEVDELTDKITAAKKVANQLGGLISQYQNLTKRYEETKSKLPHENNVEVLIKNLNDLAARSRIVITEFRSQPVKTHSVYNEIPFSMKVQVTDYANLMDFMIRVGEMDRIVLIDDVNMNIVGQTARGGSSGITIEYSKDDERKPIYKDMECEFKVAAYTMAESERIKDIKEILPPEYLKSKNIQ